MFIGRSEIEAAELVWRALNASPSVRAREAADAIALFLEELDDDGIVDRLNERRTAKSLIAGMLASLARKRSLRGGRL